MGKRTGYDWTIGGVLPELGAHSAAKHTVYERYVGAYIDTLTRNHMKRELNLTIVDGFCGGGRYRVGQSQVDGSPFRMLQAVEAAQTQLNVARARGFNLKADFVFVDENKRHIEFLRDQLDRRGYGSRIGADIRLYNLDFESACPDIIAAIRTKGRAHRSLFFLDQYGWSDVTFATVRTIMSQLANPEVILTFMVDSLVNLLCDHNSDMRALTRIDFDREDVRSLIAMKRNKGWKRLIQNTVYRHIQASTGASYYTPFFIHPEQSNRDYWLLHLSKHHQAREEMGKIHWAIENTFEHFGGPGFSSLGFDPKADVRQGMMDYAFDDCARTRSEAAVLEQLPRLLHGAANDLTPITKREVFVARCNDTPVVAEIVDSQLAELRDAKEIVIFGPDGKERRSTRRFGWDDQVRLVREPTLFSTLRYRAA
ncbi:MAG: three-Cys-motif partner protein TcmP [Alphaproteobacteria bacterium]|nr:three-Cys-motif partner protein TcmP [Alphaproteobacteria bacterium]